MLDPLILPRLSLFPVTARVEGEGVASHLTIAGCNLSELAERHGTPLYLYDRLTLDTSVSDYRKALASYYPGPTNITYAGKAFLCLAMAQWTRQKELWLDCSSASELATAAAAGVTRSSILAHGVNKSAIDLEAAIKLAGVIVVDNLDELQRLVAIYHPSNTSFPDLWLRLRPGLPVETHPFSQTGQVDSKFGMSLEEASQAVEICQAEHIPLTGIHFHQGSHFHDPGPLAPALDFALDFIMAMRKRQRWLPQTLCPGGGWGVAYHEDELPHPSFDYYVQFVSERLIQGCNERGLPLPRLQLEPGRSLVARAGVAIYRVGAIKHTSRRRWLLIDGGLADNPRPALYSARYSALPVNSVDRPVTSPAWLGGPFCESGDILIEDLPMPDLQPGELVAVPVSGAYQLSMSSNYNGALKPAVLWLENGSSRLIQRRETPQDLFSRDLSL
jgi:diaminopimelate decarboxylase